MLVGALQKLMNERFPLWRTRLTKNATPEKLADMSADRRVEILVKGAMDDLTPLIESMRAKGWPVEVRADGDPSTGIYTVTAIVTIVPVSLAREEKK